MNNSLENGYMSILEESYAQSKYQGLAKVGHLERIGSAGDVYVDFLGNERGPILARIALSGDDASRIRSCQPGTKLLLIFEDGYSATPIVVGCVTDRLPPQDRHRKEVVIDGKEVTIDGREQIVLRCGKSSILLGKNGKIILKGVDVVSRALRGNRIRGGTVKIN